MEPDGPHTTSGWESGPTRLGGLSSLRRAYFAVAGESARQYGVTFDDLLVHLWRVRKLEGGLILGAIRHVEDLVHAVACTRGRPQALFDLMVGYERPLVRHCRHWLAEPTATLYVRQILLEIRRSAMASAAQPDQATHLAARYGGVQPLRRWLGNRIVGYLMDSKTPVQVGRIDHRRPVPQVADNLRRQLDKPTQRLTLAR